MAAHIKLTRRISGLAAALVLIALSLPTPAFGHDIRGDADRSVLGYVPLGIEHMLLGWDHLLFIGGVVLIAREWRLAAKLISVFVVGHSTTLIIATLAGWNFSPGLVDVIIGASVVYVGAIALMMRDRISNWWIFGVVVFIFGLLHGLGLSTRLQDLGLPEEGLLLRVIAFNVGIEIGQLAAILVIVGMAALVSRIFGEAREALLRRIAIGVLLVGGAAAIAVAVYYVINPDEPEVVAVSPVDDAESADPEAENCQVGQNIEEFPPMGGHVATNFFEPDATVPLGDLGHSIGDGYVVILYPPDMETSDVDDLRTFVTGPEGQGILAGPSPDPSAPLKVINAYEVLYCNSLDMEALQAFTTAWFESIQ